MEIGRDAANAHKATAGSIAIPHTRVCTTTIDTTVQASRKATAVREPAPDGLSGTVGFYG